MVVRTCSPSYWGAWGRRIAGTWEVEVAVSSGCTSALQPEQQSETYLKKKKKKVDTHPNKVAITVLYSTRLLPNDYSRSADFSRDIWNPDSIKTYNVDKYFMN